MEKYTEKNDALENANISAYAKHFNNSKPYEPGDNADLIVNNSLSNDYVEHKNNNRYENDTGIEHKENDNILSFNSIFEMDPFDKENPYRFSNIIYIFDSCS